MEKKFFEVVERVKLPEVKEKRKRLTATEKYKEEIAKSKALQFRSM